MRGGSLLLAILSLIGSFFSTGQDFATLEKRYGKGIDFEIHSFFH